jgi:colicin import membrane protein
VWRRLRENWRFVLGAVLLHVLVFGMLIVSIRFGGILSGGGTPEQAVEAVVIPQESVAKPEPESQPAPQPEPEPEPEPKVDASAAEAASQRLEAARKAQEEAERRAEAERKVRDEAERKAKAEAEREAREEAERKAKAEAERKAREEAERRAKAEAEARRQAMAEAMAAERATRAEREQSEARRRYVAAIKAHVEGNWLRPPGAADIRCEVRVTQLPGGQIVDFKLLESCGNEAIDRSLEKAILKSDPLPRPLDRSVFEAELIFTFAPE